MDINIEIKNLDRVQRAFDRAPMAVGKAITDALSKAAFAVEREGKLAATSLIYSRPIGPSGYLRTGRLRNTIETWAISKTNLYAIVRSNVNYAYYVHEGKGGNYRYGRRPYMEVGAKKARVDGIFNTHILKAIKSL